MTFSQVFQRNSPKSWGGGGGGGGYNPPPPPPPPPQPFVGSTPGEVWKRLKNFKSYFMATNGKEEIEDGTIFDLGICGDQPLY